MSDPYRAPEVPAGTLAERRLAQKAAAFAEAGARERARRARRQRVLRVALLSASGLGALYTAAGTFLRFTYLDSVKIEWLDGSLLVLAIAVPMAFLGAMGMKVPAQEGNPFGGLPNGGDSSRRM